MNVPSAYERGYAKARQSSPELVDEYLRHVSVGDPFADAAVEALTRCKSTHRLIQAGMERRSVAEACRPGLERLGYSG